MRSIITVLASTASLVAASYVLEDNYAASSFASMFDFYTAGDPTDGYVNYVDQTTAQNEGLFSVDGDTVYIGVDHNNTASSSGRDSVRISSQKAYNHGLFILDLAHMPGGQCGTWPAFWLLGPSWPNGGEIDIIEGVNSGTTNAMTVHTNSGCSITSTGNFAGTMSTSNCDVNAANQVSNAGCSIDASSNATYGTGFNAAGGGVYATEWTSEVISIWFFSRGSVPSDITSGSPDPDNWGLPLSQFTGGCDIDEHIKDQQIIFDITFCGQWAGNVWSTDSTCAPLASTCQDYVQNNPSAFTETYWSVNSLQVFQDNGATSTSTATSTNPEATNTESTSTTTLFSTTTVYTTIELQSATPTAEAVATSTDSTSTTTSFSTTTTFTTIFPDATPSPDTVASTSQSTSSAATSTSVSSTDSATASPVATDTTSSSAAATTTLSTSTSSVDSSSVTDSASIPTSTDSSLNAEAQQTSATTSAPSAAATTGSGWGGWNWGSSGSTNSGSSWGNWNGNAHGWRGRMRG